MLCLLFFVFWCAERISAATDVPRPEYEVLPGCCVCVLLPASRPQASSQASSAVALFCML